MTITVDMRDNYKTWDNPQPVTLTLKRNAGTSTVAISVALKGPINRRDQQQLTMLQDVADCAWDIPDVLLNPAANARRIVRGDIIKDAANVEFMVGQVNLVESDTCWHCLCSRVGGT